ncbi:Hypothetical protein Bdt_1871 [Bdellovibrio bacteriovorus str. Tiberius]|uniref:Uncharacterized protein n=1 Tax=Bdellovibrio bacteriovorus str. Tiberius TaxID=1069642 RepID=K7YV73_BDEBC|nr:Hypothetical protein Bdt_1871 [Bdellovibrio bacteriovorus str. Tiberius]
MQNLNPDGCYAADKNGTHGIGFLFDNLTALSRLETSQRMPGLFAFVQTGLELMIQA